MCMGYNVLQEMKVYTVEEPRDFFHWNCSYIYIHLYTSIYLYTLYTFIYTLYTSLKDL